MNGELRTSGSIAFRLSRVSDFVLLAKPELTLLSVITAVASAYLALPGNTGYAILFHVFIGTLLVGGACGTLNEYIERRFDGLMKRTERRPLPSGRILPGEALAFGVLLMAGGLSYLAIFAGIPAALLATLTCITYLFIYTPLKRTSPFATIVGGIPGGLPPLIGWAAVRGGLSMEAWALFSILFFWQMPHFLSLAWMYRKDYGRAGFRMLTVVDPSGAAARRQILVYTIALLPASLMPTLVGLSGIVSFAAALALWAGLFSQVSGLFREMSHTAARRLFVASLLYLPALFIILLFDRIS